MGMLRLSSSMRMVLFVYQFLERIFFTTAAMDNIDHHPSSEFRWLKCFSDKIVPKDISDQMSCLYHKRKDFKDNLLSYSGRFQIVQTLSSVM